MFSTVAFCIPVSIDSLDRLQNLELVLYYLKNNLPNCIILLGEAKSSECHTLKNFTALTSLHNEWEKYEYFNRSLILNYLFRNACICEFNNLKVDIIVNHDTDILLHVDQYKEAVNKIRNENCDIVYPYDGKFCDFNRNCMHTIKETLSVECLKTQSIHIRNPNSLGGCIFYKKEALITCKGENEKFKGWGPEDLERYERFKTLGFKIDRCSGPMYHIIHQRNKFGSKNNPYYSQNQKEYEKVKNMSKEQLLKYIEGWKNIC